jgi:VCBS repeat-containing protein
MAKIVTDSNAMAFTVNDVTTAQTLGNNFTAKTTQGQYQVINVTIKNGGKSTATINSSDFKLTDSQGRTFYTSTDGEIAK